MRKFWLIGGLLSLLSLYSLNGKTQESNSELIQKNQFSLKPEIKYFGIQNSQVSSRLYRFEALSQNYIQLSPTAYFKGDFSLKLTDGQVYTLLPNEEKPEKIFKVYSANFNFKALNIAKLSFGLIEQNKLIPEILIDPSEAYFGVAHFLNFKHFDIHGEFVTLPTNETFTAASSSSTQLSTLTQEELNLYFDSEKSFHLALGFYSFSNLNSALAYSSSFKGNDVRGINNLNSSFNNNFRGTYLEISKDIIWSSSELYFEATYLRNLEVNKRLGESFELISFFNTCFSKICIKPKITGFYINPESGPASLASKDLFFTNSKGFRNELQVFLNDSNLEFSFKWTHAQPIRSRAYSSSSEMISLSLRSSFEL